MAIFFVVLMYKFKISNYLHMRSVASTNFFFSKMEHSFNHKMLYPV